MIKILTKEYAILLLEETLLYDNDQYILNNIKNDSSYAHVPAVRKANTFVCRVSVTLAVLWRKSNNIQIYPLYFIDHIMSLQLDFNDISYIIFNFYCIYYHPRNTRLRRDFPRHPEDRCLRCPFGKPPPKAAVEQRGKKYIPI